MMMIRKKYLIFIVSSSIAGNIKENLPIIFMKYNAVINRIISPDMGILQDGMNVQGMRVVEHAYACLQGRLGDPRGGANVDKVV